MHLLCLLLYFGLFVCFDVSWFDWMVSFSCCFAGFLGLISLVLGLVVVILRSVV